MDKGPDKSVSRITMDRIITNLYDKYANSG